MKVLFRADASLEINTGHVQRCLTLGRELKKRGFAVTYASRNHKGHLLDLISDEGFETIELNESTQKPLNKKLQHSSWLKTTQEEDAQELLSKMMPVDWIVVDHYALDEDWEKLVRKKTKKILAIDDLADRKHDCDVLLDQNEYADKERRYADLLSPKTVKLLGPQFALLREEFAKVRSESKPRSGEVKNLLICYGGVDSSNETMKAVNVARKILKLEQITVVVGRAYPYLDELKKNIHSDSRFRLQVNTSQLAKIMAESDLSLGAGGTMTWERCALGLPTIVTVLSLNQKEISEGGERVGFQVLANGKNLQELTEKIIQNPHELSKMSKIAWQTVDAKGTQKVAEHIK